MTTEYHVWAHAPGVGPIGGHVGWWTDRDEALAVARDLCWMTGAQHWVTVAEPDGVTLLWDPLADAVVDCAPTWAMAEAVPV